VDWFVSTILNKLDAKGRVSVPAEFRKVLAGQGTEGLYCIKSISREKSLTGFGNTLLTDLSAQMKPVNPLLNKNYAAQAHGMFGQVRHLTIDDEGRVRLPDDLIAHCGITERVAFVGLNAIFEIWNPETLEATAAARVATVEAAYDASGDAT
jgi:MraZ protein